MRWALLIWGTVAGFSYADNSPWDLSPAAEAILRQKCGTCHSGPVLDLRSSPFKWSEANDARDFVAGMMGRVRLEGWKKMPPVNAPPLTCEETLELETWAKSFGL